MNKYNREILAHPRAIICEGGSDEAFLRAVIKNRNLSEFCIRNPEDFGHRGIDKIGESVKGMKIMPGFSALTGILIVIDSDDCPQDNFDKVRQQIANLNDPVFIPPTAMNLKTAGPLTLEIITLPWIDQPGCLDSLCYSVAAQENVQLAACVAAYSVCCGVDAWSNSQKKDKVRLNAILAVVSEANAAMTIGRTWRDNPACLPLGNPAFDQVAQVLGTY